MCWRGGTKYFPRIYLDNVTADFLGLMDEFITLNLSDMMCCRCKEAGRSHEVLKHTLTPFLINRTYHAAGRCHYRDYCVCRDG